MNRGWCNGDLRYSLGRKLNEVGAHYMRKMSAIDGFGLEPRERKSYEGPIGVARFDPDIRESKLPVGIELYWIAHHRDDGRILAQEWSSHRFHCVLEVRFCCPS